MSEKEKYEKLLKFVKDLVISAEINSGESKDASAMRWRVTADYAKFLLKEIGEE